MFFCKTYIHFCIFFLFIPAKSFKFIHQIVNRYPGDKKTTIYGLSYLLGSYRV